MSFSDISFLLMAEASVHTQLPSRLHAHPSDVSILQAASQSDNAGQLYISLLPLHITAAASIGRALFFAPCTAISPSMRLPPRMMSFLPDDILSPFFCFFSHIMQKKGCWSQRHVLLYHAHSPAAGRGRGRIYAVCGLCRSSGSVVLRAVTCPLQGRGCSPPQGRWN